MVSEVRVKGLAELQRALDTLPAKLEKNVMRGALRAAAGVIRKEAKEQVPVRSGALRDSIRVSVRARGGRVSARVVAGGKGAQHAHLVEYGTTAHLIEPRDDGALQIGDRVIERVDHPGAKKNPFMRRAIDSKTEDATRAVAEYIRNRLRTKHGIDIPDPGGDEEEA